MSHESVSTLSGWKYRPMAAALAMLWRLAAIVGEVIAIGGSLLATPKGLDWALGCLETHKGSHVKVV